MTLTKEVEILDERSTGTGSILAINQGFQDETMSSNVVQDAVGLLRIGGVAAVDIPGRALALGIVNGKLLLGACNRGNSSRGHGKANNSSNSELHFEEDWKVQTNVCRLRV